MPDFAQNNILNYNPMADAVQSLGQVGPAIQQGQYRGLELGLRRQQMMLDYAIQQEQARRQLMMMQLQQQRMQETDQYHQQQLHLGQQREDEARRHNTQQLNEFAIKMHQAQMKSREGNWAIDAKAGIAINRKTGEMKPLPGFGGGGPVTPSANANTLGSIIRGLDTMAANPGFGTNYPTVMPTLTNMLGQVQSRMNGQGLPTQAAPSMQQTNVPPTPKRRVYNPATGQIE